MKKTLLLIAPPVLFGQRWWANRLANKPHLASLAGAVRGLAHVETLELDLVAGEPEEPLLAQVERAIAALQPAPGAPPGAGALEPTSGSAPRPALGLVGIPAGPACNISARSRWRGGCARWRRTFPSSSAATTPPPVLTTLIVRRAISWSATTGSSR